MLALRKTVERQVRLEPLEIGSRSIDTGAGDGTTRRGMKCRYPRVTKKIQEMTALGLLSDPTAQGPVI